jgi:hypothetical protein
LGSVELTAVVTIVASEPATNTPTSWFCSTTHAWTVTFARAFLRNPLRDPAQASASESAIGAGGRRISA